MADYFGVAVIAKRIGRSKDSLRYLWKHQHFLMYKRRHNYRTKWYTNDNLIQLWEVSKCLEGKDFKGRARANTDGWRNPQASSRDPELKRSASRT